MAGKELKPVRCGCGGESEVDTKLVCSSPVERKRIYCSKCYISTDWMKSEAEVITAWNMAMGERTAKATRKPEAFFYRCECGYGLCCEKNDMNYCPQCGARLEWK